MPHSRKRKFKHTLPNEIAHYLSHGKHTPWQAVPDCETIHRVRIMTSDQEKIALELINNPPPGSDLAKAKEFGVDLTLLLANLKLTPTERARKMEAGARSLQAMRDAGREHRAKKGDCWKPF